MFEQWALYHMNISDFANYSQISNLNIVKSTKFEASIFNKKYMLIAFSNHNLVLETL